MEKLRFYKVDEDYLKFLKKYESKVPDFQYGKNAKFYCGVVVQIDNYQYFAPVSSFREQQQTNLLIKHKDNVLSSIRFSFMIPVPPEMLIDLKFSELEESYRGLVVKEHTYCEQNKDRVYAKANSIYRKALNRNGFIGQQCCDFKLLEEKHDQYLQMLKEIEENKTDGQVEKP